MAPILVRTSAMALAMLLMSQVIESIAESPRLDLLESSQLLPNGASTCQPGVGKGHERCGMPCRQVSRTPHAYHRVRREVRSLSDYQWQAVVDAFWVMKQTPGVEGVAKYGDAYRPYDYFVAKHMMCSMDPRGNQGHLNAAFGTWHGGLLLEFENSLLAVDPSIEGLPYWDITLEGKNGTALNDKYLGSFPGNGPNNTLDDGPFAGWPVSANFSMAFWANYSVGSANPYIGDLDVYNGNPGGLFRSSDNFLNNSEVVRFGDMMQYTEEDFWACVTDALTYYDWTLCIHLGHLMDGTNITRNATPGVLTSGLHPGPHITGGGIGADTPVYLGGDFEDIASSPNDPIFMFHHANMDRSRMWYQEKHPELEPVYWGFPAANDPGFASNAGNIYYGANLNDVSSSYWPFTSRGLGGQSGSPGDDDAMTNAGLLCILRGDTAPYVYDDILEYSSKQTSATSALSQNFDSNDYASEDSSAVRTSLNTANSLTVVLMLIAAVLLQLL